MPFFKKTKILIDTRHLKKRPYLSIRILLFFICTASLAQESSQKKPLFGILKEFQDRFEVQFNYAPDLIEDVKIVPPRNDNSLEEIIEQLQQSTALNFVYISKTVIAIKAKAKILCGYLRDKDSNEPLSLATVQFGSKGVMTNEEGFFELMLEDEEQVVIIRHIGHKTIKREPQSFISSNCKTVYMV